MPFGMSSEDEIGDNGEAQAALVGEFALGVLSPAEHARVAARIAADPALRAELSMWRQRFAGLDRNFAEERAPLAPLLRAEARLFPEPPPPTLWNSLALWRSLAAGGVAVAVAAIGFNLMQPPSLDPREFATQLVAAIEAQEGSGVSFVALYDAQSGLLRLTSLSGEDAPDKDFELWAIQGTEAPVSMGVVPVHQRAEIALPEQVPFTEGTVLAVTLEQEGGSPTGVAQGPIVALGKATAI
jgi:anti-sigma-K factor RskA